MNAIAYLSKVINCKSSFTVEPDTSYPITNFNAINVKHQVVSSGLNKAPFCLVAGHDLLSIHTKVIF